ncbi:MAG: PspC domain-containing protein, partial [Acidimicrobiia bacterium]|nr:PspC domain-containing protein [Acidimicrobiia bacterium]
MEPTQPISQQNTRPRLERLRTDRAVAGVASGLARYLNIDVAWVRIAFVVAALFGGTGILLYLVGWIAMPEEGEKDSIVVDKTGSYENAGSWIGIGLIVLAAMIIIGNTGLIDGDLIFAGVLIVLGFLLYRGDLGGLGRSDAPRAEEPDAEPTPTYSPIVGESVVAADPEPPAADPFVYGREEPVPPAPVAPPTPPAPPDPA